MMTDISKYINLVGLEKKDISDNKWNDRFVVKHDEIHAHGRSIIQEMIDRNKNM